MTSIIRYGERMLNPFHGVINVVELDDADAVTRDGNEWILYLHGESEEERLDDGSVQLFRTPDIKYGTWSAHAGLKRAPVRSVVDFDAVESRGQALLDAVRSAASASPFPLRDRYECWLLAAGSRHPVALVDSACDPPEGPTPPAMWQPGQASQRDFVSRRLPASGTRAMPGPGSHAARLAKAVNGAAGSQPLVQWFERLPDGSGSSLADDSLPAGLRGRALAAADFPELMLATEWSDPVVAMLAEDFLTWQAPWLLQLQHLADATRKILEHAARRRAHLTAALHRLYPAFVDEKQIRAAVVEARLRGSDEQPAEATDTSMATFYVEMGAFTVGN